MVPAVVKMIDGHGTLCYTETSLRRETVMSEAISIEIPREVSHVTRLTPAELRRELAVYLFTRVGFPFAKLGKWLR
jgi:hypothetical protein